MAHRRFTGFFDRHGAKVSDGSIVRINASAQYPNEYEVFWDGAKWKMREVRQDTLSPQKIFDLPYRHAEFVIVAGENQKESRRWKELN